MPDLNDIIGDPWGTLATLALTVIPAVIKYRAELTRFLDIITELFGLIVLAFGVIVYSETLPMWERFQANLGQLAADSPAFTAEHLRTLHVLYSGSIALMVLGGVVALFGLLGRARRPARQTRAIVPTKRR